MTCQHGGCGNIGVHSCSKCGRLMCGMHATVSGYNIECTSCSRKRAAARTAASKVAAKDRDDAFGVSGLLDLSGIAIIIIGGLISVPAIWIVGLVVLGIGLLLGLGTVVEWFMED